MTDTTRATTASPGGDTALNSGKAPSAHPFTNTIDQKVGQAPYNQGLTGNLLSGALSRMPQSDVVGRMKSPDLFQLGLEIRVPEDTVLWRVVLDRFAAILQEEDGLTLDLMLARIAAYEGIAQEAVPLLVLNERWGEVVEERLARKFPGDYLRLAGEKYAATRTQTARENANINMVKA